ncbi:hypothetical protein IWT140_00161 [Secundilactobacillus pentosiphilus]|uniref:Extracellular protein n=1 Tax=Secundilactobacillus pentosiphilus TaxID=1714682 RepID=A0A1Z5ILB6_9LACO|nr:hypothetical protein [Secundilactobacillus pentosiphilus]GAX02564.1 hypothetical protein IWT140_00161 [Secundilactobacillus pentosiphilus]
MKKLSLILGSLAVAGTLSVGSQPANAATYHNGYPKTIRGNWRTSTTLGEYFVFHFSKYYDFNHAVVKTSHGWHTLKEGAASINPINTFNFPARYRKLSAHTYYIIPTKKWMHRYNRGADRMKIYKKSSKKMAIKYHSAKFGWATRLEWLYKK